MIALIAMFISGEVETLLKTCRLMILINSSRFLASETLFN